MGKHDKAAKQAAKQAKSAAKATAEAKNVGKKPNTTTASQDQPDATTIAAAAQAAAAVSQSNAADRVVDASAAAPESSTGDAVEASSSTPVAPSSPAAAPSSPVVPPTASANEAARRASKPKQARSNPTGPVVVERPRKPRKQPATPLPITKSLAEAVNQAANNACFGARFTHLKIGEHIQYCYGMHMIGSDLNVCAIRCRTSFRHIAMMFNFERGWVRAILKKSPYIFFIECPGSYPLLICAGFNDAPVEGGVGIGADGVPNNRCAQSREAVLSRIVTVFRQARLVTLDVPFPTESALRTPCEVYGTAPAMAAVEKCLKDEGREHAIRRHRAEVPGRGMVSSIAARFTRSATAHASAPTQDPLLPYLPSWYQRKNSYIDGLVRATVHLTDAQIGFYRDSPGLVVMPVAHVIDYDAAREERQLTVRFKGKIDVDAFHTIVVDKLCRNPEYEALASYVTYGTLCVTINKPLSRSTLRSMTTMLSKETTDLAGSWFVVPNSDKLPSAWEQKVASLPRTSFLPDEPIQQEPLVRRTVAVSAPVDPTFLAAIAKRLGFTLISARECDFSVTPLRFVGEWPTVEQARAMEGEDNAIRIQNGGFNFVLEVLAPLDEQRV
jgi:hypothetical protein